MILPRIHSINLPTHVGINYQNRFVDDVSGTGSSKVSDLISVRILSISKHLTKPGKLNARMDGRDFMT